MFQYAIEIASLYDLCVFLNDDVEIENPIDKYLLVKINSPREVTTKVVSFDEFKSAMYKNVRILK